MRAQGIVVFAAATVMAAAAPAAEHSSVSLVETWVLPKGVAQPHHTRPYSQYNHAPTGLAKREADKEVKAFSTVLPPGQTGRVSYDPHVALPYPTEAYSGNASDLPEPHHTRDWSQYRDHKAKPTTNST